MIYSSTLNDYEKNTEFIYSIYSIVRCIFHGKYKHSGVFIYFHC